MEGTMENLQQLVLFILLATGLYIVGCSKLKKALQAWTWQAVFLSLLILLEGIKEKELEMMAIALLTLVVKGGVIPWVLRRTARLSHTQWVGEVFLRRNSSLVVAAALTILAYAITQPLLSLVEPSLRNGLAIAFALLFYGLLLMVIRKVALIQVVGILIIDNGIFLAGFLLTNGMPLLVEVGVIFDILIGVLILGVLAQRMIQKFDSLNVEHLNSLKG
ncbi:hydrogenase 4 membrane component (E) [Desulfitobacterium dichloroeliminans LMG P-21439]|uniref:Hydrogenase 4 membrane component (E) n=1 Tax=Desulfitobacterium dichloroeliminans (strain LMG P-21439 / DCA1) TaxID=871963 RepID=L0FBK5_DESDL|nr:hydrogenase [Desulfitobacterium dichloroeliminans]AGA70405.1 hydrogenase 4 membrane component (E) [Desulfitobacterium dichloroeliminans LMG P-21439]